MVEKSLRRIIWLIICNSVYRFSPTPLHTWRAVLLRINGATIGLGCYIYPSAKIQSPWLLRLGDGSTIGPRVCIENTSKVEIGEYTVISQNTSLFTGTHDFEDPEYFKRPYMPLISRPIIIGSQVWICANCTIHGGVVISDGAVLYSCSNVVRDVGSWKVYAGNPARYIRMRHH